MDEHHAGNGPAAQTVSEVTSFAILRAPTAADVERSMSRLRSYIHARYYVERLEAIKPDSGLSDLFRLEVVKVNAVFRFVKSTAVREALGASLNRSPAEMVEILLVKSRRIVTP